MSVGLNPSFQIVGCPIETGVGSVLSHCHTTLAEGSSTD